MPVSISPFKVIFFLYKEGSYLYNKSPNLTQVVQRILDQIRYPMKENHFYTNSFSHELPQSSRNSPPVYPLNQHLYDDPQILRVNIQGPPINIDELTDDDRTPENSDTQNDTEGDTDESEDDETGGEQILVDLRHE